MSRHFKLALAGLSAGLVAVAGFLAGATLISAGVSPTAEGKGGGCGFGPGICTTDLSAAGGDFVPPDGSQSFDISVGVTRSTFVFRPKGGGTPLVEHATVVNVTTFVPQFEVDCFVIPDDTFVVSRDAQSATLDVTLTADKACPGFATPLAQVVGAIPFAGGGGGGTGPQLPLPLGLNFSWKGPGASFSTVSSSTSRCTGIETTSQFNGVESQAAGTGTVTFPDGTTVSEVLPFAGATDVGFIENANITFNQTGTPDPTCSF
jgi:hypothetical protein